MDMVFRLCIRKGKKLSGVDAGKWMLNNALHQFSIENDVNEKEETVRGMLYLIYIVSSDYRLSERRRINQFQ